MTIAKNGDADLKEISKWKKIEEAGTPLTLKRFIGDREVISKSELATKERLDVSSKTIQRNVAKGMPVHPCSTKLFQVFDWLDVVEWRDKSVDKVMSLKTKKPQTTDIDVNTDDQDDDDEQLPTDDLSRKLKADADDAELKVKLNTIKLAEAEGRVVDANDLDRAMSELAIVHKTDKINDENILPILLANKSATDIKLQLQKHNAKRLEELDKLVNKEFKSVETMYDIVEAVLQSLKQGIEPESIIKRIKGSLV